MLLAGSTRFLFLGFCTGGAGATNPHAARTKSTLGRHNSGRRISLVWLCKLPGTQKPWVGLGCGPGPRCGDAAKGAEHGAPPFTALAARTRFQWPSLVFPSRSSGHKAPHTRTARRGLHQSCPMGARLRGTPAAAPARSWRGKGRTQTPHRPLQLGSCYSTAAHRVAARTFLTTPAQGWVFTPSAHCFTQATFKP